MPRPLPPKTIEEPHATEVKIPDSPPQPVPETDDPAISAVDLTAAYIKDELKANAKYTGKLLRVEGVIRSKAASDDGTASIDLIGAEDPDAKFLKDTIVHGLFADPEAVKPLRAGQSVTIEGTCFARVTYMVMLNGCSIIKAGPVPEDAPEPLEQVSDEETQRRQKAQAEAIKKLHELGVEADAALGSAEVTLAEKNLTNDGRIGPEILAALKELHDFHKLDLSNLPISDAGLAQVAELKTVENLELLRVKKVTDAGLAHVGTMESLDVLSLQYNPQWTDAGLAHLKPLRWLTRLVIGPDEFGTVEEGVSKITDAGVAHLAGMVRLESLELPGAKLTDDGLAALKDMVRLKELKLPDTLIKGPGLKHLAGMAQLKSLNLWGSQVGDVGLEHVKDLPNLRFLNLENTRVGDAGLQKLADWETIEWLNLNRTNITDDGCGQLAGMTSLDFLLVADTSVGDAGIEAISQVKSLTSLNLKGTQITDVGMLALTGLPKLNWLMLAETKVGDAGLARLQRIQTLKQLYLSADSKATDAGIESLESALPDLEVTRTKSFTPR